ncbi:MAG: D-hexose-6-phosphate mutarotase [Planctomycetota bacterium]
MTPTTDPGGREAWELQGPGGRVRVTRLGAHVQCWHAAGLGSSPAEPGDALFTSADASYGPAVATRGGIPVVFPWFGAGVHGDAAPAHGFARVREWQLVASTDAPSLTLRLEDDAATRALWPHAFRAEFTVSVATGLAVTLRVTNTGATSFEFEEALHTYFAVGDVKHATVHGLEGVPYDEFAAAPQAHPDAQAPITFEAETDRVFQGVPDDVELRCPALGHAVALRTDGATSAVVWNPWIAKAAAMGQMRDDEWTRFVCVESANCKAGALTLAPGASHTLSLTLRLQPL